MKYLFTFSIFILFFADFPPCHATSEINFSSMKGFLLGPEKFRKATFNSLTSRISSYECVKSKVSWKAAPHSHNGLYAPISHHELSGILSGGDNYQFFEEQNGGEISLWPLSAPSSKTVELYYYYVIEAGRIDFEKSKITLSPFIRSQAVLETCGDHLFKSITMGGIYLVRVSINFSSQKEKQRLAAKSMLESSSLYNLVGQLRKISTEGEFKIYFSTLKLGGFKQSFFKKDDTHEHLFMCTNKDLDVCDRLNKVILDFLSSPEGFMSEVIQDNPCLSCLRNLKYKLLPLSSLKRRLPTYDYKKRQEVIMSLLLLKKSFWNHLELFSKINGQSESTLQKITAGEKRIHESLQKVESDIEQCYKMEGICSRSILDPGQIKIPEDDVNPDFLFLCKHPNLNTKEINHSVNILFKHFNKDPDSLMACEDLYYKILGQDRLELPGKELSDLTAFREFNHFTYLNLRNNNIEDLSPLASMEALLELNLKDNYIESLGPLHKHDKLKTLNISFNPIVDWKALGNLSGLLKFRAHSTAKEIPENLKQDLSAHLQLMIVTKRDACLHELEKLSREGIISQLEYVAFYQYNMAPNFNSDGKVGEFVPCQDAVAQFE
ncbi:MAG: leucine-rich repeat domain-containing protein [Bdellovibrio sp.]|nr:leucine-rich repeat domain-containing protein [Bdellovibrio sp.]